MAIKMVGESKRVRSISVFLFSCLLLAGAGMPMTVWAEEKDNEVQEEASEETSETGEEGAESQDALSLLRAGNDAFEAEDFEAAYDYYSKAYELFPDSTIRYRLGQSAQELGMTRKAVEHYEAYLEEGDDEQRFERLNEEVLPELRAQLPAMLAVESDPEGATVYLVEDGQEVILGKSPGEFELSPGQVQITLRLEGYAEEGWELEVEPDSAHAWAVELEELGAGDEEVAEGVAAADEEEVVTPSVAVREVDGSGGGANLSVLGWSTTGLGVALLATGGVLSVLQADATKSANGYDKRADGASREELESLKDKANAYYRGARGTYIAGGILTAAGVGILTYELLKSDKSDSEGLSLEGVVSPVGGGYVGIRGRF